MIYSQRLCIWWILLGWLWLGQTAAQNIVLPINGSVESNISVIGNGSVVYYELPITEEYVYKIDVVASDNRSLVIEIRPVSADGDLAPIYDQLTLPWSRDNGLNTRARCELCNTCSFRSASFFYYVTSNATRTKQKEGSEPVTTPYYGNGYDGNQHANEYYTTNVLMNATKLLITLTAIPEFPGDNSSREVTINTLEYLAELKENQPRNFEVGCGAAGYHIFVLTQEVYEQTMVIEVKTAETDQYTQARALLRYGAPVSYLHHEVGSAFSYLLRLSYSTTGPAIGLKLWPGRRGKKLQPGVYHLIIARDIWNGQYREGYFPSLDYFQGCCESSMKYTVNVTFQEEKWAWPLTLLMFVCLGPTVIGLLAVYLYLMARQRMESRRLRQEHLDVEDQLSKSIDMRKKSLAGGDGGSTIPILPNTMANQNVIDSKEEAKLSESSRCRSERGKQSKLFRLASSITVLEPIKTVLGEAFEELMNEGEDMDWEDTTLPDEPVRKKRRKGRVFDKFWQTMNYVAIFIFVPFFQFVTVQTLVHRSSSDICHFNYLCKRDVYLNSYFAIEGVNNMWSSLAYPLVGTSLWLYIHTWQKLGRKRTEVVGQYGLNPLHNVFKAVAIAIAWAGIGTGLYHLCPTAWNGQLDTLMLTFIFALLSASILVKRQPSLLVSVNPIFVFLGAVIVCNFIGVYVTVNPGVDESGRQENQHAQLLVYIPIAFAYLTFSTWVVWFGIKHDPISGAEFERSECSFVFFSAVVKAFPTWFRLPYARGLAILILAQWGFWGYCMSVSNSVASFFLGHMVINLFFFTVFYLYRKWELKGERLRPHVIMLFVIFVLLAIASTVVFLREVRDQSASMDVSRAKNQECIALKYYDTHDLWHLLSAYSIGAFCLFLYHVDDDLEDVRTEAIACSWASAMKPHVILHFDQQVSTEHVQVRSDLSKVKQASMEDFMAFDRAVTTENVGQLTMHEWQREKELKRTVLEKTKLVQGAHGTPSQQSQGAQGTPSQQSRGAQGTPSQQSRDIPKEDPTAPASPSLLDSRRKVGLRSRGLSVGDNESQSNALFFSDDLSPAPSS